MHVDFADMRQEELQVVCMASLHQGKNGTSRLEAAFEDGLKVTRQHRPHHQHSLDYEHVGRWFDMNK